MAKIVLGWIALFLTAVWAFFSWNAYVCNIKGFCGNGAENKASYSRIYDDKKSDVKPPKKMKEKEEGHVIREVFFRSSEGELAEILAPDGQRVVVAMWKKEAKTMDNPVTFEQFLENYREESPKKRNWVPKDFFPEIPVPPYGDTPGKIISDDFPTEEPKNREEDSAKNQEGKNNEEAAELETSSEPEPDTRPEIITNEDVTEFCADYITVYIQVYADNDKNEVIKLERFLKEEEGHDIVVDGFYSLEDNDVVKKFQAKYAADVLTPLGLTEPTGNVYAKTMQKINSLHCAR